MRNNQDHLKPDETIQKVFISTTSRVVGEYRHPDVAILPAWPSAYDATANLRFQQSPISRSGYILAFQTPPLEKKSGVVIPDYTEMGEVICAHLSVLFGKRFDCHGPVEGSGLYRIPDYSAYYSVCNPQFPHNSHCERKCFPIPLALSHFSKVENLFVGPGDSSALEVKLGAACKFYMRALQNEETNAEVSYLHLITTGEILSRFYRFSREEVPGARVIEELMQNLTAFDRDSDFI